MQTVRRFLVLAPVAFVVTTVAYLIYVLARPDGSIDLRLVGIALLVGLVGAAIVLTAVLVVAIALLRLWGVSNAWAALGLAFGVIAIIQGIDYATIGDDGWRMLTFQVLAGVQVPGWLTFAVGLLVGDLRNRAARNAVRPAA
ncbi:hypothetical protein [Promicromonospora sp. NPDC060271]|uniref:hypothetical protein n=1 Tax=Promicromonospora sp. NPDC060271 TaxID=3347089 RepID=UPI00366889B2